MSRGPGRIQRVITDLIAEPDGAWLTHQICRPAYPEMKVAKVHRTTVNRALRKMTLPMAWGVRALSNWQGEYCLYDRCSLVGTLRCEYLAAASWRDEFEAWRMNLDPRRLEEIEAKVAAACRYREASPAERIEIEEAALRAWAERLGGRALEGAYFKDEIAKLQRRLAELVP